MFEFSYRTEIPLLRYHRFQSWAF